MNPQTNFLEEIVNRKRSRLEDAKAKRPMEELRTRAVAVRGISQSHALERALTADGPTKVIAEIKRASPSKGVIRENLDPGHQARAYARGGAAALSIVTEQDYFLGSLDDLRAVRASTSLPILRKDFIFDSYQVYETAEAGADALLLIVALLEDEPLRELLCIAQDELGMDALVEVHTAEELRRARDCGARIVGVNNRDLTTFEVSLGVSVEMARIEYEGGRARRQAAEGQSGDKAPHSKEGQSGAEPPHSKEGQSGAEPPHSKEGQSGAEPPHSKEGQSGARPPHSRELILVSESGLSSAADLRRLQALGFKAFLIGETLMRAENPEVTLRSLIQETDTVRVKVCGITNLSDALLCVREGVDMLGFNFYAGSPRYIAPPEARRIMDQLPPELMTVGVFVDEENADEVIRIARLAGVDAVQLHGDETAEFCRALLELPVIKALRVGNDFAPETAACYETSAVLLDAFSSKARGGTGRRFDWSVARKTSRLVSRLFLAGGLTPENVGEAITLVKPYAVDVCSSLESAPGIKSEERLKTFMAAVRNTREEGSVLSKNNNGASTPDQLGHWGRYGGRYVPETLISPLDELTEAYQEARADEEFQKELASLLRDYSGRPTPLTYAKRLSDETGGARIYLKREDLSHTGSHKINNALGQVLLARRMGKQRIIAETGAGQHGVATATVCALFGLECVVYMGAEDMRRQALNVFRMQLLGAEVREVDSGSRTLKDAINEAMRDWVTNVVSTYYLLGSALGPHPYPSMVRDFQSIIGRETRAQVLEREGRLPDVLVACVGGGSNSIGLFHPFLNDECVRMIGVEAGGNGPELGQHAARFHPQSGGRRGVLQGTMSYVLQDQRGQISRTHSISAGLDYPSIGPEHAHLHDQGRVHYVSVTDAEAVEAFQTLSRLEGIIPALESAHAVAHAIRVAADMERDAICIINLSGRGDKDVQTVADVLKGD